LFNFVKVRKNGIEWREPSGKLWENAVNLLETSFTGPLARALSLIAIVIGGLMFAFGEGQSKKVFAGIVFGLGIALGAVNFMSWLFGVA
jgi:type IV secretory pathway VirB2 component (pilin)